MVGRFEHDVLTLKMLPSLLANPQSKSKSLEQIQKEEKEKETYTMIRKKELDVTQEGFTQFHISEEEASTYVSQKNKVVWVGISSYTI